MRFLTPAVFFGAAGWVWWTNTQAAGKVIAFTFLDAIFPSLQGNVAAQGDYTVALLAGLGAVFLVRAIRFTLRQRQADEE